MKKTLLLIIFSLVIFEYLEAQGIKLPEKILISDKYSSMWGTELVYEYELNLKRDVYYIQRNILQENETIDNSSKEIGTINKKLIEDILIEINRRPTKEIKATDFFNQFPLDSINEYIRKEDEYYYIFTEHQKQFVIEQFTEQTKLKKNLELYFRNYDHSEYIDGSSTEIKIDFYYADSIYTLSSTSILWYGLPIVINGETNFSPRLAKLIGELIPDSKTNRKDQFSGEGIFYAVFNETIDNHKNTLAYLESKTYQVYIDSLEKVFNVSDIRVINGLHSVNWSGEKRLGCSLRDSSMLENISFSYTTTIENGKIKYPVSLIISDYRKIYEQVMSVAFFRDYLMENTERKLSIIYDDNSCFTKKSKQKVLSYCKSIKNEINFENSVFIDLSNEFRGGSRWGLLQNGKYFIWWYGGILSEPPNDENYLECK